MCSSDLLAQRTIVVGMGNLGRALLSYPGFQSRGFEIVAAFDTDPKKIGVRIGRLAVRDLTELEQVVREHQVSLAMLAVPADAAVDVARRLWEAGVSGILNFAPTSLVGGEYVNVDVAAELQQLSFRARGRTTAQAASSASKRRRRKGRKPPQK